MMKKNVSVAGANSLLGQHLLARLVNDPYVRILSLHDRLAGGESVNISDSQHWNVDPEIANRLISVPLLPPEAPALASVLLSFLPDDGAQEIEAQHLARGTRVITHCEYARLKVPLVLPSVGPKSSAGQHLATPNCTTAICAQVLQALHATHGVKGTTITTLQAISGTDLPGMHAHTIHDQVVGHLEGEARGLSEELGVIFENAFVVDVFATRVPVWRGHTVTMSITLKNHADAAAVRATLFATEGIAVSSLPTGRDRFSSDSSLATVTNIRDGAQGVLLVLKGDNLEMATTGLMQHALHSLGTPNTLHQGAE
jgi:aspartate-semialdehyde dehydrogenase